MTAKKITAALKASSDPEKAAFFSRFFKNGPGEYAEGDKFLGVTVPKQRKVATEFSALAEPEIVRLLDSQHHECRLTAVFILVHQFEKAQDDLQRKRIYELYLSKTDRINNWDLVDASAHKIVGPWLNDRSRKPLYKLARSRDLWENRIAIIATFHFIRQNDLAETLTISKILLERPHDLIHKAVGWMLRELGKRDEQAMIGFIRKHYDAMPRTMLRYAIEKLPKLRRQKILAGNV